MRAGAARLSLMISFVSGMSPAATLKVPKTQSIVNEDVSLR